MKKILFILILFGNIELALGQNTSVTLSLNEIIPLSNIEERTKDDLSISYFKLNESVFESDQLKEGVELEVETQDGVKTLRVERISEFIPGIISIRAGSIEEGEVFSFSYSDGRLHGLYHGKGHTRTIFRFDAKKKSHLITTKSTDELACTLDLVPESDSNVKSSYPGSDLIGKEKQMQVSTSIAGTQDVNTTIDVMAVYTQGADTWAIQNGFGSMSAVLAQAFNLSQTVLDNSEVPITLRVVHVHKTSYAKPFDHDSGDILRLLTASPSNNPFGIEDGEMDEVHELRDEYGTDIVSYFDDVNDTGGLAWRLNTRLGTPDFGFNLNRVQQVTDGYTLIHEIGHNMGNAHSRSQETQTADISGGVFMESVGYHDFIDSVYTVMGYGREGFVEAPFYSTPDIEWQGNTIGSTSATGVANAAQSARKIKGVIASYRASVYEPPVANIQTSEVSAMMDQGNTLNAKIMVQNTGESSLDFDVDFERSNGVALKKLSPNISDGDTDTLYYAGFERSEDFFPRSVRATNGWRAYTSGDSEVEVIITSDSAKTGSGHLQLLGDGSGGTQFVYSPFFQGYTYGSYRASFDILVSEEIANEMEQYEVVFIDGKTGEVNSGISLDQGKLFVLGRNEIGGSDYYDPQFSISPQTYYNIAIDYNSMDETIYYQVDGDTVYQVGFLDQGNVPQEVVMIHSNAIEGSFFNIDNLAIVRTSNPYSWLNLGQSAYSVPSGETIEVPLTFNTFNVGEGVYNGSLTITTNEKDAEKTVIPIQLTVSNVVSNESDEQIGSFKLEQNFPNPFNPSTNISYSLQKASNILLEVYDIQGRKVAVLDEGNRPAGNYTVTFDASRLASGMYIYRLKTPGQVLSKRMLLIK
jgi:hypothetical protein